VTNAGGMAPARRHEAARRTASSSPRSAGPSHRSKTSSLAPRRRSGSGGIRWDRVGRTALLLVLGVIVLLYIPPVTHWIEQRQTSSHQQAELEELQREHQDLQERIDSFTGADSIERQARSLGMVRENERAIVVEGLPEE
jgi:cell division protein FtsB